MLCLGLGCERDLDAAEQCGSIVHGGNSSDRSNLLFAISRIRNNQRNKIFSLHDWNTNEQKQFQYGEMFLFGGRDYKSDYSMAGDCYRTAARSNVLEAEVRLGQLYYYGLVGNMPDYGKAAKHFQTAAEAGVHYSQTVLGSLYRRGLGVEENRNKAAEWLELAAIQGYSQAQYELGVLLGQKGIDKGWQKALHLLMNASAQGHSDAQCLLGDVYRFGLMNCENDMDEAMRQNRKSSNQGNIVAKLRLKGLVS